MKIGSVILPNQPVILAPMEDVTDPPFRYMCKKMGADLMFSEFVSSEALIRNVNKTLKKMEIYSYEHPYGIQIYGKNTHSMVLSAKITESQNPDMIDMNFGCPVKKVAMKGAGAGMLRDVPQMIKMCKEVVRATKLPVTVKTRLGWDEDSQNIIDIAEKLQDTGIAALTIHARTRSQMYKGEADWTLIGAVKNHPRIKIPIIGNGDIDSPERAKFAFDQYGVDGIMVGRAAIGRPRLFKEIKHYLITGEILPPPTVSEQIDQILEHMNKGLEMKDPRRAVVSMRRFFAVSFKGLSNIKETRIRLLKANTKEEVTMILEEIRSSWGDQSLKLESLIPEK